MSTKSKRRSSRRQQEQGSQGPSSHERLTPDGKVVGEIMGAVLNAITFGALEGPASRRSKTSESHPKA